MILKEPMPLPKKDFVIEMPKDNKEV